MASDLEKQQQGEHFTIIDRARAPERPFKPNRLAMMMASLVLAFFFGVALVIVQDNLSGTIKAERELKNLLPASVKFLGSVPRIDIYEDRQRRLRLRTVAVSISFLGCVVVAVILWRVHPIL